MASCISLASASTSLCSRTLSSSFELPVKRAHAGSSLSGRNGASEPVVPIRNTLRCKSMLHYKERKQTIIIIKLNTLWTEGCFETHLMPLQHIQAEQYVHWLILQHGKTGGQEIVGYLQLNHVNASNDTLCTDTFGHTTPSKRVNAKSKRLEDLSQF